MFITVNGKIERVFKIQTEATLLHWLREELNLTGTKNGCGSGFCGTCTVLVNNKPVKSCVTKVYTCAGKSITTIEAFANEDGTLHPLQQAFIDEGAVQCGFCTPGMILTAHAFLLTNKNPTKEEVRAAISPNLCRCTGYQQIIDAVMKASAHYRKK